MNRLIIVSILPFLAWCSSDLSSVNRTAVCSYPPAEWTAENFTALQEASGESGRDLLDQWRSDVRCRVYLLRRSAADIALDASSEASVLKARAGQMTLEASLLRDHFEGLLDHNWMANNLDCPPDGERPQRRDSTSMAKLCVNQEDHSHRLHKLLKMAEQHAQFSAADSSVLGIRAHAEHVLNCLQTTSAIDWDDNGTPEQMCGGDLGDYGLEGDGLGDYVRLVYEQVIDYAVLD